MTQENQLQMTVTREASVIGLTFAAPKVNVSNNSLAGADLHNVDLSGADLNGVDLRNANLRGANLRGAVLTGADLRGATLTNANLRGTMLNQAMLSGATLSCTDLRGADLSNTILSGANLWDANLSGANLDRANLWDANLSGANLTGVNLKGAILSSVDLRSADLSRSNLWGANLSGANFSRAKLVNVDFSSANLNAANFWNADLTNADLNSALVQDTRFGQNQGLTQATQCDLKQRGAIFVNTLADRKPSMPSQFASKNEISQTSSVVEITPLKSHMAPQILLPKQADLSSLLIAPDGAAVKSTLKESDVAPQAQPLSILESDSLNSCESVTTQVNPGVPSGSAVNEPVWIPEYDWSESEATSESTSWATQPEADSSSTYLSPIARTAAEIRQRRAKSQTKNGKQNRKIDSSLMRFSY